MKRIIFPLLSVVFFNSCSLTRHQKESNTEGWAVFVAPDNKMSPKLSVMISKIIDGDKKSWEDFTRGLNHYHGETRHVYSAACAELLVLYPGGLMARYLAGDDTAIEVAQRGFDSIGLAENFSNLKSTKIRNQIIEYYRIRVSLVRSEEKPKAQHFLLAMLGQKKVMQQGGYY